MAEPGDTDALAHRQPFHAGSDRIDPADDLVTRDDRRLRVWKFPIDDMQIRPADAARCHLDPNLPRPRLPIRQGRPFKGSLELFQHHCLHNYFPHLSRRSLDTAILRLEGAETHSAEGPANPRR